MKTKYPNLYRHVKAIHRLKDGPKRLHRALKSINEDSFEPYTWWDKRHKFGWLSAHCMTLGERDQEWVDENDIPILCDIDDNAREFMSNEIVDFSQGEGPYGNKAFSEQGNIGANGMKKLIRYVLNE